MLFSGVEHFTISTASGDDDLTSGDGDDVLSLGGGNDTVTGRSGNDVMDGGTGSDMFRVPLASCAIASAGLLHLVFT